MLFEKGATPTSPSESYDDFATALQQRRLAAGAPSYSELAHRIAQNRMARGLTPAAARVARSSVYDVFRLGRTRVNLELVDEIIRALDADESEVARWHQRALGALNGRVNARTGRGGATPPSSASRPDPTSLVKLATVVLCIAAVGVNLMLNFTVGVFEVPLYLDMVGTAFVSFAVGPWAGAAVGVATNMIGNLMAADFSGWWFSLVQVAGAVIWGYGLRGWFGRAPWRFFVLNVTVAVACSFVAVLIILFAFGGAGLLPGGDSLAQVALQLGAGLVGAVFSVNMVTSIIDKLLSGYLALILLSMVHQYGFPLTETVRDRLDSLSVGRLR